MKQKLAFLLALVLLLGALTGCGKTESVAQSVDLQDFFNACEKNYEFPKTMELDAELLDALLPGLTDVPVKQLVAQTPLMSAVVSEYIFVEVENSADVKTVQDILQARVTYQAEGGAWYPESMDAWSRAVVLTKDNYVLMIANSEHSEDIAADFAALFS